MKKKFIALILSLISISTIAQIDRSKVPLPGSAPEIRIPKPKSFQLKNGLQVFIVENHKLPRVSFNLIIDRDLILEREKKGYVQIAGQILRRGTKNRTKDQIDEEIDFIGGSLSTYSNGLYASSLKKHMEKLLELVSDILLYPSFPEEELNKIKTQTLSSLAAQKDDPNSISNNLERVLLYGKKHPYGELTTEQTISNITIDDCRKYYRTYFKPNISYLAIVGDITKKEAKRWSRKYFEKWGKGTVPNYSYNPPKSPLKNQVAIVDRPNSVQSVIKIAYPISLKPGTVDDIKSNLMNKILGGGFSGRLFANLRETHGYTYGAYSSLSTDKWIGRFSASANVRNAVTDSSITQFFVEFNRICKEKVDSTELKRMQNYMIGSFTRRLEDPSTIADFALNIKRYDLSPDYYKNYLKGISAVSVEQIYEMANKYILPENAYILIVGKADEISEKLSPFGDIVYYDIYGEKIETHNKN